MQKKGKFEATGTSFDFREIVCYMGQEECSREWSEKLQMLLKNMKIFYVYLSLGI